MAEEIYKNMFAYHRIKDNKDKAFYFWVIEDVVFVCGEDSIRGDFFGISNFFRGDITYIFNIPEVASNEFS